jgi:hypothetical protein
LERNGAYAVKAVSREQVEIEGSSTDEYFYFRPEKFVYATVATKGGKSVKRSKKSSDSKKGAKGGRSTKKSRRSSGK